MKEKFVTPRVYFMSFTEINEPELTRYLQDTDQLDFLKSYTVARGRGLSSAEILCSFFAKLCYKALVMGKNANLTRTRDIWDNIVATFDAGHGAVFEHVNFGFVVHNCSRVYTHEQVRHRIAAYSQTSGRYCRLDQIPIVLDPILDDCKDILTDTLQGIEKAVYLLECRKGLRIAPPGTEITAAYADQIAADPLFYTTTTAQEVALREQSKWVPNDKMPFHEKKKLTSAIRRIAPQGIANELGFTINLRTLRHQMMVRTAEGAEWEIRLIFNQIHGLVAAKFPLIFHGEKERMVDGAWEYSGYKIQPYEKTD